MEVIDGWCRHQHVTNVPPFSPLTNKLRCDYKTLRTALVIYYQNLPPPSDPLLFFSISITVGTIEKKALMKPGIRWGTIRQTAGACKRHLRVRFASDISLGEGGILYGLIVLIHCNPMYYLRRLRTRLLQFVLTLGGCIRRAFSVWFPGDIWDVFIRLSIQSVS